MINFALFETALGACGIVWSARGVCGVQLPEKDAAATRARLMRRHPAADEAAPTPAVQRAIAGIVALLAGEKRDLTGIAIDDEAQTDFNKRVYDLWRDRRTAGRQDLGARGRPGHGRKPNAGHHAVPPRAGRRRQNRRFLRLGRCSHQTAPFDHRRRATGRADFVRPAALEDPSPLTARNSPDPLVA